MNNSDTLIRCENLSKKFCRDLKRSLWYGLTSSTANLFGNHCSDSAKLREGEFWANNDISFELKRGECLGLIGKNGAGKTTLLKMLNGLIKPDIGRIEMRGRIGALIALGAGFNPVLTGRENIYVNSSILGISKREVRARFDEIVEFSELCDFIDTPVRNYSSGMSVRLGFAVAVVLMKPDVLLLDEVLAVGDAAFRAKCLNRIIELLKDSAVVFVSHNETQIKRICDQVLLLENGCVKLHSENVFEAFLKYNTSTLTEADDPQPTWVTPRAEVLSYSITPGAVRTRGHAIQSTDPICLRIQATAKKPLNDFLALLLVRSSEGEFVAAFEAESEDSNTMTGDVFELVFQIDSLRLATGHYNFAFALLNKQDRQIILRSPELFSTSVVATFVHGGSVNLDARMSLSRLDSALQP